jgi:Domain of Unknown Function (DUF1206)
LVTLIVLGLAAMAIWQIGEAVAGHRAERGRHRVYERVVSAGRAVFYLYLGSYGVKVLRGKHASAVRYDPEKARGLDAALRALAQQAYGPWLLLLTAIGFAAYGLFSIAEAKYREV